MENNQAEDMQEEVCWDGAVVGAVGRTWGWLDRRMRLYGQIPWGPDVAEQFYMEAVMTSVTMIYIFVSY